MLKFSKILSLFKGISRNPESNSLDSGNGNKAYHFQYKTNKFFSITELVELKNRLLSGETPVKIAHSINLSYKNLYRIMERSFPGEHGMLSPKELKKHIVNMYRSGVPAKDIAKQYGYNCKYVYMLDKEFTNKVA